jgi:putative ABC transport system ATP-binding protein
MGETLVRAADNVTLSIGAGEFVALLGSSGSGKSTLLNLMAGLDRPTSGAIFAHDRNLAEMSSEELAKHRSHTIGIVFQAFNLLPRMTLEENVELPLRLAEVERSERTSRVREAANSSAPRSPARWSISQPFCSQTSPLETSTARPATKLCSCCAKSTRRWE